MSDVVDRARDLADAVLRPAAEEVDATATIPEGHFRALADAGFYGLAAPPEAGGPDIGFDEFLAVVETLAGACLTTTFTWMQHHGTVRGLADTANIALRERHLAAAVRGDRRCGVAFAGAIPQPPQLWATAVDGGWRLDGVAPLVTGWGLVDLLLVSARDAASADADDEHARVVALLVPARPADGVTVHPLDLAAANGSRTVRLDVDGWWVPDDAVVSVRSRADFLAAQHGSARVNGCLALGIAGRCAAMVEEAGGPEAAAALRHALDAARAGLDGALADPSAMPAARATASALAVRAAATLTVAVGSRAIVGRHPARRLAREAAFTLVAAGRPEIRTELLGALSRM
ncbi:acyl-CoA dehydrogenase family protein [Actinomycetospora cinnamomea]|uniref:Alkylation response protein AidB-like acyl-CoA dehydrogenase n=1 Tax=Actinomycetospora cinnamomea TaxID=663609 RepID=A0A2U1FM80_9PSEU|nr:acyl-CoA dehydrogenase family protein [Actinomycetospora cinnamomea]PVZ13298.1 alkylation response protein AidB-like acyl-CoA dehydrogenase [Actinomycetospora cinnamomea]